MTEARIGKFRIATGNWKIDIYGHKWDSLIIAEINRPADAKLPAVPKGVILGPEVTDNESLSSRMLAGLTLQAATQIVEYAQKLLDEHLAENK